MFACFFLLFFMSYVFLRSMREKGWLAIVHAVIWIVIIEALHKLLSHGTKHALSPAKRREFELF